MEIKWEAYDGKKIFVLDYRGLLLEKEMIAYLHQAVPVIQQQVNKGEKLFVLSDLTGCFATPGFIEAARKLEKEVLSQYQLRWAVLGITGPKVVLLKGFNLFSKIKLEPFDAKEDAMAYLAKD